MKHSGRRSHVTALLTALLTCLGLLSLSTAPAWAKVGTIKEFSIPPAESDPLGITAGPDGNLWFTATTAIGRITTAGLVTAGLVTAFPIPSALGGPQFITAGPDGNLWFTALNGNAMCSGATHPMPSAACLHSGHPPRDHSRLLALPTCRSCCNRSPYFLTESAFQILEQCIGQALPT